MMIDIRKKILFIGAPLLCLLALTCSANERDFTWPKGIKAAVSLGYDDALNSQLDNAIPALNKYGLKGTFYLAMYADTIKTRLDEWRAAAKNGHELGNHSLFHQCSGSAPGRDWVTADYDLDKLSPAQMQAQVRLANSFLHAIDGKTQRTFTAPCIDSKAGGQDYLTGLQPDFVAFKATGGDVIPDMQKLNPYMVPVNFPNNVTGEQLIALVKEAAAKGTMINFTFHGVGGDYITTSNEAHEALLKYLAEHKDIYWTDTFLNVMTYVKQQQSKTTH